jgi:hypothetical protein
MSFPRAVQKRILKRCSEGKPVVVVPRNGKPSRVFSLESYVKTVQTASRVKPWIHRRGETAVDPLGAVPGRVVSSLRREEMYE